MIDVAKEILAVFKRKLITAVCDAKAMDEVDTEEFEQSISDMLQVAENIGLTCKQKGQLLPRQSSIIPEEIMRLARRAYHKLYTDLFAIRNTDDRHYRPWVNGLASAIHDAVYTAAQNAYAGKTSGPQRRLAVALANS